MGVYKYNACIFILIMAVRRLLEGNMAVGWCPLENISKLRGQIVPFRAPCKNLIRILWFKVFWSQRYLSKEVDATIRKLVDALLQGLTYTGDGEVRCPETARDKNVICLEVCTKILTPSHHIMNNTTRNNEPVRDSLYYWDSVTFLVSRG